MAFETLTKSLTEAGLAPEVVTQLVSNEKAAAEIQKWHEGGLRQSDYDRKMNSGKAEIEASRKSLQEQQEAFENQKKAINDQYLAALTTREQAEAQLATLRAKARTQSDIYGVDLVKDLFGDTPPPAAPTKREEPAVHSDFEKRMGNVESLVPSMVNLTTELMDIERAHDKLFPGQELNFNELIRDATAQRRTPTQVWDDKFGATARRNEIMADKYRAEGAAKAKEELEKKYSGQMVNGIRTDIPTSPLFDMANNHKGPSSPKDRVQNGSNAVQAAVAAFASGKYRQGGRAANEH